MTDDLNRDANNDLGVTADDLWDSMRLEWLHLLEAARSRIVHCLSQLTDEQVWRRPFPDGNSIANQLLHVCGNLRQWVVDGIRQIPSSRDRDAEFADSRGFTKDQLLSRVDQTLFDVQTVLKSLSPASLTERREIQGFKVTVAGAISHSIPHFVGHTHQIMLITRLQLQDTYQFHWTPDGDRSSVPL